MRCGIPFASLSECHIAALTGSVLPHSCSAMNKLILRFGYLAVDSISELIEPEQHEQNQQQDRDGGREDF